jgi:CheY-like chemotaxis protein
MGHWSAATSPYPGERVRTAVVIDDEPAIRYLVGRWLDGAGYRVRTEPDAARGLRFIEGHDSVDIVVTDVVMPEINGHDVYSVLAKHRPEIPVIGISAVPHLAGEPEGGSEMFILIKPFSEEQLLRKVQEIQAWVDEIQPNGLGVSGQGSETPTDLVAAARRLVTVRERRRAESAARRPRCPRCEEGHVGEIRYGSSPLPLRDFAARSVIPGGEREEPGAPRWECLICGYRWRG